MTLKSMTGFGRSSGVHGETSWHWEVRSVNGRGLELRFRMPSGLEGLEIKARSLAREMLARGNCTLNLTLRREAGELAIRLNEAALSQALAAAKRAQGLTGLPLQASMLCLACGAWSRWWKGRRARRRMRSSKRRCSRAWHRARPARRGAEGGGRAAHDRHGQPAQPDRSLVERAAAALRRVSRSPSCSDLSEQIARLIGEFGLDPERLHQEALLLAARQTSRKSSTASLACGGAGSARARPACRAQARIPGAGIQPRGQHHLLQGVRYRDQPHRARAQDGDRSVARAGPEHRVRQAMGRSAEV